MSTVEASGWTPAETEVLVRSMMRAPSVHNTQPWVLEAVPGELLVRERSEPALPHHDPHGRDRAASCGAAVANLELAVRTLGRSCVAAFRPEDERPDLAVGELGRPGDRGAPLLRGERPPGRPPRTVRRRRRARGRRPEIVAAGGAPGVEARASTSRIPAGSVPWAGLVRRAIDIPETPELERRLALLLFVTVDDSRLDHVRAGYAMERAWLAAVDLGLAAAVLTQPLHLAPVRSALCEDLGLTGFPQALLRIGSAAEADPPSPRRAVDEVLRRGP